MEDVEAAAYERAAKVAETCRFMQIANGETLSLRDTIDTLTAEMRESAAGDAGKRVAFILAASKIERDVRLSELTDAEIDQLVAALNDDRTA